MPELLKRQIDRLETAIDLSTDWLEVQYLMVELDQLKALYDESESEAAWSEIHPSQLLPNHQAINASGPIFANQLSQNPKLLINMDQTWGQGVRSLNSNPHTID